MCNYPSFHFSTKIWPWHPDSQSSFTKTHPSFSSLIWRQDKRLTFACKKHEDGGKWRVVGEKREKFPTESREHGEQIGSWKVLHDLWSACSWWFDAVPSGPAPNICLVELQVLGSGIHGDWLRENCDSCPVGLFMPYGGWISKEQTIVKKQIDKIKRNSSPKNETLLKVYSFFRQFEI